VPAAVSAPAAAPRTREIESPRPSIAPPREAPSSEAPLRFGTPPSPEEELFKARKPGTEVESVLPIGKAPALNLDKGKPDAVAGRSDARKGVLNLFPPPPEKESKLARDIQKAAQPDCRDAYAAMGLFAVPLLLKDTITDTGCRW
jgi:hypothetical protein